MFRAFRLGSERLASFDEVTFVPVSPESIQQHSPTPISAPIQGTPIGDVIAQLDQTPFTLLKRYGINHQRPLIILSGFVDYTNIESVINDVELSSESVRSLLASPWFPSDEFLKIHADAVDEARDIIAFFERLNQAYRRLKQIFVPALESFDANGELNQLLIESGFDGNAAELSQISFTSRAFQLLSELTRAVSEYSIVLGGETGIHCDRIAIHRPFRGSELGLEDFAPLRTTSGPSDGESDGPIELIYPVDFAGHSNVISKLPQDRMFRVQLLLSLLAKELIVSSRIGHPDVISFRGNQIISSTRIFEVLLGDLGTRITDTINENRSLASLFQSDNTFTFEDHAVIDGDQSFDSGTRKYVEIIFDESGNINTAEIEGFVTLFGTRIAQITNLVSTLVGNDELPITPTRIYYGLLERLATFFDALVEGDLFVEGSGNLAGSRGVVEVLLLKLASSDNTLRNLLYGYVLALGLSKNTSHEGLALFKHMAQYDVRTLGGFPIDGIETELSTIDGNNVQALIHVLATLIAQRTKDILRQNPTFPSDFTEDFVLTMGQVQLSTLLTTPDPGSIFESMCYFGNYLYETTLGLESGRSFQTRGGRTEYSHMRDSTLMMIVFESYLSLIDQLSTFHSSFVDVKTNEITAQFSGDEYLRTANTLRAQFIPSADRPSTSIDSRLVNELGRVPMGFEAERAFISQCLEFLNAMGASVKSEARSVISLITADDVVDGYASYAGTGRGLLVATYENRNRREIERFANLTLDDIVKSKIGANEKSLMMRVLDEGSFYLAAGLPHGLLESIVRNVEANELTFDILDAAPIWELHLMRKNIEYSDVIFEPIKKRFTTSYHFERLKEEISVGDSYEAIGSKFIVSIEDGTLMSLNDALTTGESAGLTPSERNELRKNFIQSQAISYYVMTHGFDVTQQNFSPIPDLSLSTFARVLLQAAMESVDDDSLSMFVESVKGVRPIDSLSEELNIDETIHGGQKDLLLRRLVTFARCFDSQMRMIRLLTYPTIFFRISCAVFGGDDFQVRVDELSQDLHEMLLSRGILDEQRFVDEDGVTIDEYFVAVST